MSQSWLPVVRGRAYWTNQGNLLCGSVTVLGVSSEFLPVFVEVHIALSLMCSYFRWGWALSALPWLLVMLYPLAAVLTVIAVLADRLYIDKTLERAVVLQCGNDSNQENVATLIFFSTFVVSLVGYIAAGLHQCFHPCPHVVQVR